MPASRSGIRQVDIIHICFSFFGVVHIRSQSVCWGSYQYSCFQDAFQLYFALSWRKQRNQYSKCNWNSGPSRPDGRETQATYRESWLGEAFCSCHGGCHYFVLNFSLESFPIQPLRFKRDTEVMAIKGPSFGGSVYQSPSESKLDWSPWLEWLDTANDKKDPPKILKRTPPLR
jgi:hypothetical protein